LQVKFFHISTGCLILKALFYIVQDVVNKLLGIIARNGTLNVGKELDVIFNSLKINTAL